MVKYSWKNSDYKDKVVLIRTSFDVPIVEGQVDDATRIYESLPAIKTIASEAKKVILVSHLGRPKDSSEMQYSLKPVAEFFSSEFGLNVDFCPADLNALQERITSSEYMDRGKMILLENIRFFSDEESSDPIKRREFAARLAEGCDIFINDSFPSYREAASTYDVVEFLPSFIGPAFEKEVVKISKFKEFRSGVVALLGGAKLSEKIELIQGLAGSNAVEKILVGGAMAYTLLAARGIEIGNSLVEAEKIEIARDIISQYNDKLVLPDDHLICAEFSQESAEKAETTSGNAIPTGQVAIDIGEKTREKFAQHLADAKAILWNGPLGVTEWEISKKGTVEVISELLKNEAAYKLTGGGDSISAINRLGLKTGWDHISTGGGAMLSLISYNQFPTLDVINAQDKANMAKAIYIESAKTDKSREEQLSANDHFDITVIYATCSGNAELVAQSITAGLEDAGLSAELVNAWKFDTNKITTRKNILLVSSTWNVGQLQESMIPIAMELSKHDLSDYNFAIVGLGDSKNYDIFCGAADILEETIKAQAGNLITDTLRIDGTPHARLDEYRNWGKDLGAKLSQKS